MKTKYTLKVAGRHLTIMSEDTEEHVRQVEKLVNERITSMGGGGGAPIYTAVLLAALDLADELLSERGRHGALKEKIRSRSNALLRKLDNLGIVA